ncbi:MAG TPA: VOC family protein [Terriglobales bacterium]|nr:VOC family protein [Terriglobales bacterium]
MPKRSLFDQLNHSVEGLLAGSTTNQTKIDPELAPLAAIAAELRMLPRPEFRKRLQADFERSASMASMTEPATATRTFAAPRLTFRDPAAAIEFYKSAFGARETMRFETPSGIGHAEIMIGDSVIMLAGEWPEGNRYSAETLGNSPVLMQIEVPDVDASVARALGAGAELVAPATDQFYGSRDARVRDPFGYIWGLHTVKEEMTVEEMHQRFQAMMKQQQAKEPAVSPVPKGYRTVTPYLVAKDGAALIDFMKQTFSAEELFRDIGSAGGIHCELRVGDSMLMAGGGIPGREFKSTANTHALHVFVEDPDAVYQRALKAGATSIQPPRDQEYGERSASVKDPAGNFWYIAKGTGESYIPRGLNNVNVYMHPRRAEPVINFLKRGFGAQEIARYASPDGVIQHAEIRVGTSVVEMGEAHDPYQPMPAMFYLYVPDCDAVYRRALAAGAVSVAEPVDQPYGDRSGAVKDAFGNTWYIATNLREVAPRGA